MISDVVGHEKRGPRGDSEEADKLEAGYKRCPWLCWTTPLLKGIDLIKEKRN
jgi:hypothetical protein